MRPGLRIAAPGEDVVLTRTQPFDSCICGRGQTGSTMRPLKLRTYNNRQYDSGIDVRTACRCSYGFSKGVYILCRVSYRCQARRGAGRLDRREVHLPPVCRLSTPEHVGCHDESMPTCRRRTPNFPGQATRPGASPFRDRVHTWSLPAQAPLEADVDRRGALGVGRGPGTRGLSRVAVR